MELNKQVTSLEISKRLKELGVKQESLWFWINLGKDFDKNDLIYMGELANGDTNDETLSAFTVAELGEMLPRELQLNGICDWFCHKEPDGKWRIQYRYYVQSLQEADARGKMLIYLLENKLI